MNSRKLKEWLISLGIAMLGVFLLYQTIWPMIVEGNSMAPALKDGQIVFVSKLIAEISPPKTGDLIVVQIMDSGEKEFIIKRIIGVEGDHVILKDGRIIINGTSLDEPYVSGQTDGTVDLFVGKNAYFILGDNRSISKDSRIIGCVSKNEIRGLVIRYHKKLSNGLSP